MPPKRKAASKAKAGGKKVKNEPDTAPATLKDAAEALKAEDKKSGGKKKHKLDTKCPLVTGNAEVLDDYDCMLNQTNIGQNNNKYYVIQLIKDDQGQYYTWNRWGRVGESGATALNYQSSLEAAIKDFEKKFRDKTKNAWKDRHNFTPKAGKYTLLEMADEEEDIPDASGVVASSSGEGKKVAKSKLDVPSQKLLKFIFDHDMFKDTMKDFDIDVKKMPLGKLSKGQIAKGFEVLDEIEKDLNANKSSRLNKLSSQFYTVIPHDFGRRTPPLINTIENLRMKMDMLLVLGDIEIAQSLQKEKDKKTAEVKGDEVPNPIDVNYDLLNCKLELLDPKSEEFKVIKTYTDMTGGRGGYNPKIQHVWKVNREGEADRFKVHDKLGNRKLLWHGTKPAVVAAILKGGLRIMPHSGGRVGAGIYFASENSKSAAYVGRVGKRGIMFLNEVVLGKEMPTKQNMSHLQAAPKGYDSVVAMGVTEPDPKNDTKLKFDGKEVIVPQGKPKIRNEWSDSHFGQSEYLIYKESQNRIRYILIMDF